MARTDLKIYSKIAATGKNSTTNITHVNPEATSTQLKGLATRLNAFTTNEYQEADRVNTINVDTEEVLIPDTIEFVPNPTYTKYGQTIQLTVDQIKINGQTPTTIPQGMLIFGTAERDNTQITFGLHVNPARNELIINTINGPESGSYVINIALQTQGKPAATATTTITVS